MTPGLVLFVIRVILGLILYAFLGMILLFLWKEIQSHRASEIHYPPAVLVSADGSNVEVSHSLIANNRIGRAADNTLVLQDETASAHHARLSFHEGQWWLEDLGSRNGTAVNGIGMERQSTVWRLKDHWSSHMVTRLPSVELSSEWKHPLLKKTWNN